MTNPVKKTALVTGAARGLGFEIARRLIADGMTVVITDVAEDAVGAAAEELGSAAVPVRADVTSDDDMTTLFRLVEERLGRLDVVIANAGAARVVSLPER